VESRPRLPASARGTTSHATVDLTAREHTRYEASGCHELRRPRDLRGRHVLDPQPPANDGPSKFGFGLLQAFMNMRLMEASQAVPTLTIPVGK
jgi:hypothetical protein